MKRWQAYGIFCTGIREWSYIPLERSGNRGGSEFRVSLPLQESGYLPPAGNLLPRSIYARGSLHFSRVYVFCHILAGLLLGLAWYAWKRDRLLVAACVAGAVLPDLIDKPLGILLTGTVGFGRIYAHTLLFAALFLIAGAFAWRGNRRWGFLILALGSGVISHQILDAMWFEPAAWFWPLFGPFPPPDLDIPFLSYFLADLLQPAEWLFAAASFFIVAIFLGIRGRWMKIAPALSLLMAVFSIWVFLSVVTGYPSVITGWNDHWDNMIVAIMLLLSAAGVDRVPGGMWEGTTRGRKATSHDRK